MKTLPLRWLVTGLALTTVVGCGSAGLASATIPGSSAGATGSGAPGAASATAGASQGARAGHHSASATAGATAGTVLTSQASGAPGTPASTSSPTGRPTPTATPKPTPTPPPVNHDSICGTWPMIEVNAASDLHKFSGWIGDALSVPGVAGFSIRAPWTSITANLDIYTTALQIAQSYHVGLAIRFGGGVHTPAQYMGNSTTLAATHQAIPLPWGAGSTPTSFVPNTAFEAGFTATVHQLAAWSRANGVHELHLTWYSGLSDEIYEGPEIVNAPGFSLQNFLTGYERLIDIAMASAGNGLTVEFPSGGIWSSPVDLSLRKYIAAKYGTDNPNIIVQWNDLTDSSPTISGNGVQTGRQMLYAIDYNWAAVYQTLIAEGSKTLEIWVQSFVPTLPHAAALRQQIAAFAARC